MRGYRSSDGVQRSRAHRLFAVSSLERFWRVMSRAIFEAPMMRPCESLMGETVSEMSIGCHLRRSEWSRNGRCVRRAEALQDAWLLVVVIRRDQDGDGPADRFVRDVAEYSFRARIPGRDDAVKRLGDDGVVGRVDHRRKVMTCGFGRRVLRIVLLHNHPVHARCGNARLRLAAATLPDWTVVLGSAVRLAGGHPWLEGRRGEKSRANRGS